MKRNAIKRSTTPLSRKTPLRSHSTLKTSPAKPRTQLRAIGKKGAAWIAVRKQLKQRFEWAGITICEFRFAGCYYDASGGFAHCKKRRKLLEGEIWHVGLACLSCHTRLDEKMTHEEMEIEVHKIIDKRGLIVPPSVLQQIQEQEDRSGRDYVPQSEGEPQVLGT